MGHLFAWGLLRHGRCGLGKFDPNSEYFQHENKPKFDAHVPKYPREIKFTVNSKGQYREGVLDDASFYQPLPKMLEHLKTVKIVHAAVGECHSAAVSFDNKLYTWGVARHGRLGDVEDWDQLHRDPLDEAGRYRALPELVESVDEIVPIKVACTNTSTIILGSIIPPQWQQFVDRANSRFGWLSDTMSRGTRSPGSSRPTSAGTSRVGSRANSRPGSASSQRSDQSPRPKKTGLHIQGLCCHLCSDVMCSTAHNRASQSFLCRARSLTQGRGLSAGWLFHKSSEALAEQPPTAGSFWLVLLLALRAY